MDITNGAGFPTASPFQAAYGGGANDAPANASHYALNLAFDVDNVSAFSILGISGLAPRPMEAEKRLAADGMEWVLDRLLGVGWRAVVLDRVDQAPHL